MKSVTERVYYKDFAFALIGYFLFVCQDTISKDLVIKMIVYLDINGKVINLIVHKQTKNDVKNNYTFQPYLESAIRAIKKASPFEGLRKDRYNNWKELIINFKPIEARQ